MSGQWRDGHDGAWLRMEAARLAREARARAEQDAMWDAYTAPYDPLDDDGPDYMGGAFAGYQSW